MPRTPLWLVIYRALESPAPESAFLVHKVLYEDHPRPLRPFPTWSPEVLLRLAREELRLRKSACGAWPGPRGPDPRGLEQARLALELACRRVQGLLQGREVPPPEGPPEGPLARLSEAHDRRQPLALMELERVFDPRSVRWSRSPLVRGRCVVRGGWAKVTPHLTRASASDFEAFLMQNLGIPVLGVLTLLALVALGGIFLRRLWQICGELFAAAKVVAYPPQSPYRAHALALVTLFVNTVGVASEGVCVDQPFSWALGEAGVILALGVVTLVRPTSADAFDKWMWRAWLPAMLSFWPLLLLGLPPKSAFLLSFDLWLALVGLVAAWAVAAYAEAAVGKHLGH